MKTHRNVEFQAAITEAYTYDTPDGRSSWLSHIPLVRDWIYHWQLLHIMYVGGAQARTGVWDRTFWGMISQHVLHATERAGGRVHISGLDHVKAVEGPCVLIANHMSLLETFALPSMLLPYTNVTYVLKESLLKVPYFGDLLRIIKSIAVGRSDPRADLKAVMTEGQARLEEGISVIIFPQSTRSTVFRPSEFNTLGVKLAARAGVPVVPLALRTDFLSQGRMLKDFGPVHRERPVHFAYGPPVEVTGKGKEAHDHVIQHVRDHLESWGVPVEDAGTPEKET